MKLELTDILTVAVGVIAAVVILYQLVKAVPQIGNFVPSGFKTT